MLFSFHILKPFAAAGGIFFPIGRPPVGTCEWASKNCAKYCYAAKNRFSDFDEETRISKEDKWKVYNFIMNENIVKLHKQFRKDLDGLQTPLLHWFGSGDCMTKDTDKISEIVSCMSRDKDIIQMGFTRNKKLWRRFPYIFALTVETEEEAKKLGGNGIYSIPDYEGEISIMYNPEYTVRGGRCGPTTCRDSYKTELEHLINCQACYRLKTGCFDKRF